MGKAKRGQKVTGRNGQTGIITDIVGSIIYVMLPGGKEIKGHASNFHKAGRGPCLVWIGGFVSLLLIGSAAVGKAAELL